MKSQIALIGIGLTIAAGVAYVELKPTSSNPVAPVVSTPASTAQTKTATEMQAPIAKPTPVPAASKATISKPKISGGDDEEGKEEGDDD